MDCARTRSLARTANWDPQATPAREPTDSQEIGWASYPHPRPVQHVRVDHRGADVTVTQQLLYRADVMPGLEQMGGEAVPQRVAPRALVEAGPPHPPRKPPPAPGPAKMGPPPP